MNSIYEKKGLAVLHFLGVILWTLCFMFGFNYWTGDIVVSICVSLALAILLMLFVNRMMALCPKVDQTSIVVEKTLLGLYIIVSIASAVYIYHMVTITAQSKIEIQEYVQNQQVEVDMYFNADSEQSYPAYVEDRYSAHNKTSGDKWMNKKQLFEHIKYGGDDNTYRTIVDTDKRVFDDNCYAVEKWNWFNVSKPLKNISSKKIDIESKLVKLSEAEKFYEKETILYKPAAQYNDNMIDKLETISGGGAYLLSLLAIIILQAMMLAVFVIYKKDNGRNILKSDDTGTRQAWERYKRNTK